jgi:hypothetical protein
MRGEHLRPVRNAEDQKRIMDLGKERKAQNQLNKLINGKSTLNLLLQLPLDEFINLFNEFDQEEMRAKFARTDNATVALALEMQAVKEYILRPQNYKLLDTILCHANGKPFERQIEAPPIDIPIAQDPMDIINQLDIGIIETILKQKKNLIEQETQSDNLDLLEV